MGGVIRTFAARLRRCGFDGLGWEWQWCGGQAEAHAGMGNRCGEGRAMAVAGGLSGERTSGERVG